MFSLRILCVLPLLAAATLTGPSIAQEADAARQYFTDVELTTQDGKPVRLYSDLLKGRVVVINSFFGTCTGSCPKMAGVLAGLQNSYADRLGKDVLFLSFSVDPEMDTPAKLKQYAEQFHAKPGWLFLTGPKQKVDLALGKLGQKVERKEDHLTLFIVGLAVFRTSESRFADTI